MNTPRLDPLTKLGRMTAASRMKKMLKIPAKEHMNPGQTYIFVFEDAPDVVVNLQNSVEQNGYEVSTAPNENEVLRQMLDAAPDATVLALQIAGHPMDRVQDTTENSQEHASEVSPPEMTLKWEMLDGDYADIIGESAEIFKVLHRIELFAKSPTAVLVSGETGTGKELIVRALHERSNRSDKAIVVVNCAGISEQLMESELFGYEKGAFTGAETQHIGLFETARGGTLFLDEIGELSTHLQPKLLRVLQEGKIRRVGGTAQITVDVRVVAATNCDLEQGELSTHLQPKLLRVLQEGKIRRVGGTAQITVDVRVVAATNCDLEQAVKGGRFRQDLYQRLKPLHIFIPPLRQRKEDIPMLVEHFLKQHSQFQGEERGSISPQALALIQGYDWPGNIRELEGIIIRALLLARGGTILPMHLPTELQADHTPSVPLSEEDSDREEAPTVAFPIGLTLKKVEQMYTLETLEWMDRHRAKTASVLGISVRTLRNRLKNHTIF